MRSSGALADRRQKQNLRWFWSIVEDRLRQAIGTSPAVQSIRPELEREVLAGTLAPKAAARRILEAFGLKS